MILYSLAAEIGCTVAELSSRLSVSEFEEWIAYRVLQNERIEQESKKRKGGRR